MREWKVRVEGESGGREWRVGVGARVGGRLGGGRARFRGRGGVAVRGSAAPEAKQVARGRVARVKLDGTLKVLLVRVRVKVRVRVRARARG